MFEIRRYQESDFGLWNDFLAHSKQGTFLLDRHYMEYHADRFSDFSLIFYYKDKPFALLPANRVDNVLYSHQGLTYGGLITQENATAELVCDLFSQLNDYLKSQSIDKVIYKAIPWIYHQTPAEEDLYALTQVCKARLCARDISSVIIMDHKLPYQQLRRRCMNKARRLNVTCSESGDLPTFWQILDTNLSQKYGVHPVHSLQEITLLHDRFPHNIRLFMSFEGGRAIAGTLVYETPQVIHTQYISASPEGKSVGGLDLLFDYLINKVYPDRRYFDFGKSTEDFGRVLNRNLIFQKEGFGARGICYDTYEYDIS